MEKLEKFIKENRPSFDDKTPDRSIWIGIEQKLDKQDSNKIIQLRWFKVAAGVILILCCGILIGLNLNNSIQLHQQRNINRCHDKKS